MLHDGSADLRGRSYRDRRQRLTELLAGVAPPLYLVPMTNDHHEALRWFTTYPAAGVEGLVVKGLDSRYQPGVRGWVKVRHRHTADAVGGGVLGPLRHPTALVLGRPDTTGALRVCGATQPLPAAVAAQVGLLLQPAEQDHPWSAEQPTGRLGGFSRGRERTSVRLVVPVLVVEVLADTAWEHGRWRHRVRLLRLRPELSLGDLTLQVGL